MADSVRTPVRRGRKSITATPSPRGAGSTRRKESPAVGSATNTKVVSEGVLPLQVERALQSFHPRTSSVGSISSADSSIKSPVFDRPIRSPVHDSPATSPEKDLTGMLDKVTPSKVLGRPQPERKDADFGQSPRPAAQARRKSSTTSPATRAALQRKSRPSIGLGPPPQDIPRASSAPNLGPQTNPGSSWENPICIDNDELSNGLGCLTLGELTNATTSGKHSRTASVASGHPADGRRSQTTSASGRMEGKAVNEVGGTDFVGELDDTISNKMDWEPSANTELPVCPTDAGSTSPKAGNAVSPTLRAASSREDINEHVKTRSTPACSSAPPDLDITVPTRTLTSLRVSVPEQPPAVANSQHLEDITDMMSTSGEDETSKSSEDDVRSESDARSEPGDFVGEESFEANFAEHSDLDDTGSESNAAPPYPAFRRYREEFYDKKQIEAKLILRMRKGAKQKQKDDAPEPQQEENGTPRRRKPSNSGKSHKDKGYIYVYSSTSPVCKDKYFKTGWTAAQDPKGRENQQKDCGMEIYSVEDKLQRAFYFSGLVDVLIQIELHEERRKFSCSEHKGKHGGPVVHEEWYEIEPERLLKVIEKWRSWITESDPYDWDGSLKPRWVWKLDLLDKNREGVDLDYILQPFTWWQDLSYRWDVAVKYCDKISCQGAKFLKITADTALFLFMFFVFILLVCQLGINAGSFCFVTFVVGLWLFLSRK
jgi:hypothetical protein